ncbi:MAG TPA: GTPase HflX [Phycisphaerales bacterium]|nr:GTPase HflX [Phycisphaerales bacterium]
MPSPTERQSLNVQAERAVLAAVRLPESKYDPRDPFGELRDLAQQAGAQVVGEMSQRLERPVAGTCMGKGKIDELKALCEELGASTIIFDHDLSPRQIGNIEKATLRKVVDRSELILDIFAARATTAEAKLQIELAQLEYTYPRLRAMWSHLERIRGGVGTRGPGEMQLEIDRRLVADRKVALKRELATIQARRRREVFARKQEHFTVGIVGYTNAGKSTLFNSLTAGGAYADDRLFATLTTRTREWSLGRGLSVMLSDTVGFVRDIPHHLVASFKATLEEATHADMLLILLDVSDPAAELQYKAVTGVLDELIEEVAHSTHDEDRTWRPPTRHVLLNKVDRLADNSEVLLWQRRIPGAIPICALPGGDRRGIAEVTDLVRDAARGAIEEFDVTVPLSDGKTITLIERQGEVLERSYDTERPDPAVTLRTRIGRRQLAMLQSAGARIELATAHGKGLRLDREGRESPAPAAWGARLDGQSPGKRR